MTWVRIDDHFDEHPKLAEAGTICWGIWLAGIAYCNRNLTDGFIPWTVARSLGSWEILDVERDEEKGRKVWSIGRTSGMGGEDMDTEWIIERLVFVGLWDQVDGGFRIHDYDDYQPSKAEVMEERSKNKDRQADWRKRHPKNNAATNAGSNAVSHPPTNGSVTGAPYPVPEPVTEVLLNVLSNGAPEPWVDPWQLYQKRSHRKSLSQKERDWIEDLNVRHSRTELCRALEAIPPGRDYLRRVDDFLEGAA